MSPQSELSSCMPQFHRCLPRHLVCEYRSCTVLNSIVMCMCACSSFHPHRQTAKHIRPSQTSLTHKRFSVCLCCLHYWSAEQTPWNKVVIMLLDMMHMAVGVVKICVWIVPMIDRPTQSSWGTGCIYSQSHCCSIVTTDFVLSSTCRCPSPGAVEGCHRGVETALGYVGAVASAAEIAGLEARYCPCHPWARVCKVAWAASCQSKHWSRKKGSSARAS